MKKSFERVRHLCEAEKQRSREAEKQRSRVNMIFLISKKKRRLTRKAKKSKAIKRP